MRLSLDQAMEPYRKMTSNQNANEMTYLDFRVNSVVIGSVDMQAWVPFVTTLLEKDVVLVNLRGVTPFLDTEATTS